MTTTFRSRASGATFRILSLLAILLLALAPAAIADVTEEETIERSATLASGGEVVVEATNGSIRVETWDGDEVRVVARKKARADDSAQARELLAEIDVRVEESGGTVKISADLPRSGGWFGDESASVSYEITMPKGAELDASSKNGSIEVREIGARARLETQNGSITAKGVGGRLEVESNNGSIKAYDVEGAVHAETTNGSIKAEIVAGELGEDMALKTTNGSIELRLESGVAASIYARTRNGSVSSDFPGGVQDRRRRTLDLDLNGGGPRVELESSNGSIRVRER